VTYWNDSLLVGVSQIDNQHRKLVESIGQLMDACKEGKGRDEVAKLLNSVTAYTKEHFLTEEGLQEKYEYPGIGAHKRSHAHFVMNIGTLKQDFDRTGPNAALVGKINKTLMEWLENHISTEDKAVGTHITKAGG